MIETSLERCTEDLRQEVMKNAIFCEGLVDAEGLEDRVHKELSRYGEELHINFDWQRRHSSWIGLCGWLAEYFPEFGDCAQRYRLWKYVRQRYN